MNYVMKMFDRTKEGLDLFWFLECYFQDIFRFNETHLQNQLRIQMRQSLIYLVCVFYDCPSYISTFYW